MDHHDKKNDMNAGKLNAKLCSPTFEYSVHRERLYARLESVYSYRTIWIHGQAGSGKTTLVGTYLRYRKKAYIWYQIDSFDNDITAFFHYLTMAVANRFADVKIELPQYDPHNRQVHISSYINKYIEQLYAIIDSPLTIVFDDMHKIDQNSSLYIAMQDFIRMAPEHISIYITSRFEPPKVYARLYAEQKLSTIGWDEIRFTHDETEKLIDSMNTRFLSENDVSHIYKKTSGWAVGIRILAKYADFMEIKVDELEDELPEAIYGFFTSELLHRIPAKARFFLMATSILPPFTNAIAHAVTGFSDTSEIIAKLIEKNVFTTEKESGYIYEYHPMFQKYLQEMARKELNEEQLSVISNAAADIYENLGQRRQAVKLYLDAGAWEQATRILYQNLPTWLESGRYHFLSDMLKLIPREIVSTDPRLLMIQAGALKYSDPEVSGKKYLSSFRGFMKKPNEKGQLNALIGMLAVDMGSGLNFAAIDKIIRELDESTILRMISTSSTDMRVTLVEALMMHLVLRHPTHSLIPFLEKQVLLCIHEDIPVNHRISLIVWMILRSCLRGDKEEIGRYDQLLKTMTKSVPLGPEDVIKINAAQSLNYFLKGSFNKIDFSNPDDLKPIAFSKMFLLCTWSACALSTVKSMNAEKYLDYLQGKKDLLDPITKGFYCLLMGWRSYLIGHVAEVESFAMQAMAILANYCEYFEAVAHVLLGLSQELRKRHLQAQKSVNRAMRIARKIEAKQIEFLCYISKMEILFGQNHGHAIDFSRLIRKAFSMGRRQDYFNNWFWRPKNMARICAEALQAGIEIDYTCRLIRQRKIAPVEPYLDLEAWPWPVKIKTIDTFECLIDGKAIDFQKKTRSVTLKMLQLLIALGGRGVPISRIKDTLWPDANGDVATNRYKITFHRLQKYLGHDEALIASQGQLSLNPKVCYVDLWPIEKLFRKVNKAWHQDRMKEEPSPWTIKHSSVLISKIDGIFLSGVDHFWVLQKREAMKSEYMACLLPLCAYYESKAMWPSAIEQYHRAINIYADIEFLYQRLIDCCSSAGRFPEAIAVYQQCKKKISQYHALGPSGETKKIVHLATRSHIRSLTQQVSSNIINTGAYSR